MEVPSPAGPIETWVVSPPGAGDARLPTIVDVHGVPLGAWAPAPHLEVFLLAARGYRVVLPNIRDRPRTGGTGSGHSSGTGAGWMPPMCIRRWTTSSPSAWPIRIALASWD